jgi:mevalonate kinase
MLAYEGEKKAHGGAPSGVDNMTTYAGHTKLQRVLNPDKTTTWNFEHLDGVSFPKGTQLFIVDTHKAGEVRGSTGTLVGQFAQAYGLSKIGADGKPALKPMAELTDADHARLAPFDGVFDRIVAELRENGDPAKLGKAMLDNHALLRAGGVSNERIETLIAQALAAGAYGAKGTGALGPGGAVILYADQSKRGDIEAVVAKHGLRLFPAKAAKNGASLTSVASPSRPHVQ